MKSLVSKLLASQKSAKKATQSRECTCTPSPKECDGSCTKQRIISPKIQPTPPKKAPTYIADYLKQDSKRSSTSGGGSQLPSGFVLPGLAPCHAGNGMVLTSTTSMAANAQPIVSRSLTSHAAPLILNLSQLQGSNGLVILSSQTATPISVINNNLAATTTEPGLLPTAAVTATVQGGVIGVNEVAGHQPSHQTGLPTVSEKKLGQGQGRVMKSILPPNVKLRQMLRSETNSSPVKPSVPAPASLTTSSPVCVPYPAPVNSNHGNHNVPNASSLLQSSVKDLNAVMDTTPVTLQEKLTSLDSTLTLPTSTMDSSSTSNLGTTIITADPAVAASCEVTPPNGQREGEDVISTMEGIESLQKSTSLSAVSPHSSDLSLEDFVSFLDLPDFDNMNLSTSDLKSGGISDTFIFPSESDDGHDDQCSTPHTDTQITGTENTTMTTSADSLAVTMATDTLPVTPAVTDHVTASCSGKEGMANITDYSPDWALTGVKVTIRHCHRCCSVNTECYCHWFALLHVPRMYGHYGVIAHSGSI